MRWIFITLVIFNIGYLGWGLISGGAEGAEQKTVDWPALRGDSLVLLTERLPSVGSSAPPPTISGGRNVPLPGVEVAGVGKEVMCTSIGPFETRRDSDALVKNLEVEGYKAVVQALEISRDTQYWVLLPPYPNRAQALQVLKQLQTKNFDSYLMATGEMKNAISLGLFNREASAKGVLDRIQLAGFEPEIRQKQRVESEYWVRVVPGQAIENLQETLETLVPPQGSTKISSASCEMFALTQ